MSYIASTIGTMGSGAPQRSVMDMKLQADFNPERNIELYTDSPVGVLGGRDNGFRSVKDNYMNMQFNPYYREMGKREGYNGIARITDNPNNPYNDMATYAPLR